MEENKSQPNTVGKDGQVIHTYASDMADAVRENEMTVIKIALAEQNKHEREDVYRKAEGTTGQKILWVVGGIVLIGLGIVVSYFLLRPSPTTQNDTGQQAPKEIATIVPYDNQVFVDATKAVTSTDMEGLLKPQTATTGQAPGSITSIFITENTGTQQFMSIADLARKLELSAPNSLLQTLSDTYMVGTYQPTTSGSTPHLFFLFQTNDYEQAYAGMLTWEKTLLSDLFPFFNIDVSGTRQDLLNKPFKDIIIENKDARVLYDDNNKEVLYYLFIDKNTLMVTDNVDAIKEVIGRLIAKNTKPL